MVVRRQAAHYGEGKRQRLTLREYVAWWRRRKQGLDTDLLYLKDWHFADEYADFKVRCSQYGRLRRPSDI